MYVAPKTSMGSAEGKLLSCNVQQVRKKELEIGTIVEDGVDLKKSKDLGLEKELCQVHMARCQRRRVLAINFSAETVGKTIRSAHFKKVHQCKISQTNFQNQRQHFRLF